MKKIVKGLVDIEWVMNKLWVVDKRHRLKENKSRKQYKGDLDLQATVTFLWPSQSLCDSAIVWYWVPAFHSYADGRSSWAYIVVCYISMSRLMH